MKYNLRRVAAFFLLIALSVGFGFLFDRGMTAIEKRKYQKPADLVPLVEENAAEFGIPEAILWAWIRTESGFSQSLLSDDGRIGLLQISPEEYAWITETLLGETPAASDVLYGPGTNLRCGAAYLSYLYQRYGVWKTVFAARRAGCDAVDAWLADPDCINAQKGLETIPDRSVAEFVRQAETAIGYYTDLYE